MIVWIGLIVWILFIRTILGKLHTDNRKKQFLILTGIVLVLVMGCRYTDISSRGDLNNYARLYVRIQDVEWKNIFTFSSMEPGYLVLNKAFSQIFPWAQSIVFIEAIICVAFTFRFIYKFCNDVMLAIFCYLAQGLFIFELTGFRQAIAISICLFSVEFVEKRKFIKFILLVGLAYTFHTTAVIFIPFYFIANLKPAFKTTILYIIGTYLLMRFTPTLLLWGSDLTGSDYSYAGSWGNLTGPLINLSFNFLTIGLMYFAYRYKKISVRWKWNMTLLGIISYMLRFISLPFERISFYFTAGCMVALPDLLKITFNDRSKRAVNVGFLIICILLFLIRTRNTVGSTYNFFW